jgi:hypothetical protein
MKTRLVLVVAILGTAFLLCRAGPPSAFADTSCLWQSAGLRPSEPHAQPQNDAQDEIKEFKGKISKSNGRFVLEESSNGGSYGTYVLDDQAAAKKYEGQRVVVTGTLDVPNKTIHVQKIEAIA